MIRLFALFALLTASSAFADQSYFCTASYIVRYISKAESKTSGKCKQLVSRTVSTLAVDYSDAKSGGGGAIMGTKTLQKSKDGTSVYVIENMLKDSDGNTLEPIGQFSNDGEYNLEVAFYTDGNSNKQIGPDFKVQNEGTQIAEVKPNEFIQVTCNFVTRFKK